MAVTVLVAEEVLVVRGQVWKRAAAAARAAAPLVAKAMSLLVVVRFLG